jgi:hypothetical protein
MSEADSQPPADDHHPSADAERTASFGRVLAYFLNGRVA